MPASTDRHKFKRDVINASELEYVRKMKFYYESQLHSLSRVVGEKTEHKVVVTDNVLKMLESRLSDFEQKEKKIIENYGEFVRNKSSLVY